MVNSLHMETNTTGMGKQIAIWGAIFGGTVLIIGGMIYMAKRAENAGAKVINDTVLSYAQSINLNLEQFTNDFESKELKDKIQEKITEGRQIPINYTPAFFINGTLIDNPRSVEQFKTVLDQALTGAPVTPSTSGQVTIPNTIEADDWVRGNKAAKVVLVEYSDFECPGCGAYYPIVEQLVEEYGDKIAYIYRHFPLTAIHKNAETMARAAEAAGKQGKFWDMYHLIFTNQSQWAQ